MSRPFPSALLHGVFILSGVSALIYQLVWQRALLMLYGSNSESVAMVVAAFLMGLGIGSLLGGWVTKRPRAPLVLLFGAAELGTAAYGLVSLRLFDAVGTATARGEGIGWLAGVYALRLDEDNLQRDYFVTSLINPPLDSTLRPGSRQLRSVHRSGHELPVRSPVLRQPRRRSLRRPER